jgi:hypothetical protein
MHHYEWGFGGYYINLTINDETGNIGINFKLFPGKRYKGSGVWTWRPDHSKVAITDMDQVKMLLQKIDKKLK